MIENLENQNIPPTNKSTDNFLLRYNSYGFPRLVFYTSTGGVTSNASTTYKLEQSLLKCSPNTFKLYIDEIYNGEYPSEEIYANTSQLSGHDLRNATFNLWRGNKVCTAASVVGNSYECFQLPTRNIPTSNKSTDNFLLRYDSSTGRACIVFYDPIDDTGFTIIGESIDDLEQALLLSPTLLKLYIDEIYDGMYGMCSSEYMYLISILMIRNAQAEMIEQAAFNIMKSKISYQCD